MVAQSYCHEVIKQLRRIKQERAVVKLEVEELESRLTPSLSASEVGKVLTWVSLMIIVVILCIVELRR